MIFDRVKGDTSQFVPVQIDNSTSGAGLSGLVFNSAGLTCYYYRQGATASTAVTLATAGTKGTWTNGAFQELDATNMPGLYQIGLPDAALATGADWVTVYVIATGAKYSCTLIRLTGVDIDNTTSMGITTLATQGSRPWSA